MAGVFLREKPVQNCPEVSLGACGSPTITSFRQSLAVLITVSSRTTSALQRREAEAATVTAAVNIWGDFFLLTGPHSSLIPGR